ncbi:MAG: ribosome maturation factor RimP [Anaerovibrio sp.]|uniref:ribosome maturation factor RimP n=1 Tax=Anaerovibrio lipolyticus TaxID=82374 RepID=UPI001F344352|nr:ribosome maturation factor RimP [Anaerovibrio lipolyticus]MCI7078067.1 ribosome maturation factor RimP [Veillonellaceae bacterium]MDY5052449.1 ribosome maturation factor RimP [Anaerovibrio sp.]MCF2601352.1 ribosome maturation factor RimP [Anaerovibrio lipolyticus]MCI7092101.1 ribosome maturation factor RimP [Veillonellaceae bacterium]MCI7235562.1 ribosome maturation factor RimP [Veillonellaceae bacterium]
MAGRIEAEVEKIVEELLENTALELVAVDYVKERDWYLRVFIDKEGGVDLDDCQDLSRKLEELLDAQDLIKTSYILEVSSPGLDRELKKPRDFQREMGKDIDVSLFAPLDGKKVVTGPLSAYDGETINVGDMAIPMDKVAKVNLHIDF